MTIQWSLVLFTALTGAAGWLLACVLYDVVRGKNAPAAVPAAIVAVVLMAVGGCASVTHLGHPERMLAALGHPTSGIFVEAVLLGLAAVCAIAFAILAKRGASAGACKVLAALAAVFGVALSFMAGHSYMMASTPAWDTLLLPLGYLGTAVPSGVGLYALIAACAKGEGKDLSGFGMILAASGAIALVTAAAYAFASGSFGGQVLLWAACLVLSGVVPAACGILAKGKAEGGSTVLFGAAFASALIGSIVYRCTMWLIWLPVANYITGIM